MNNSKIAVVWFLFVFIFYLFYDSYFSLFILVSSLIILLFLVMSIRLYKHKVQVNLIVPEMVSKMETSQGCIEAKNDSFLPIVKVTCTLRLYNSFTGETRKQDVYFSINGKGMERVYIDLKSVYCGNVRISVESVSCFDLLGLFSTTHYPKASVEMIVLPKLFDMNIDVIQNKSRHNEASAFPNEVAGMNSNEIIGMKPYLPGDNVKNIHWKLSGKFDDLIMKEFSETVEYSLLLLLDNSISGRNRNSDPAVCDSMMEAFLSVSRGLLEVGQAHAIGWLNGASGELQIEEIFSEDQLSGFIRTIMALERKGQEEAAFESYLNKDVQARFSQIVYITSQQSNEEVSMWSGKGRITVLNCIAPTDYKESTNDEYGVDFTPESIQEDLRHLVI